MIRLPLSAIGAFAAVAPFMAKQDDNYALTGALLDPARDMLEATDRHAIARYHFGESGENGSPVISWTSTDTEHPLWIPGALVEWIAGQKPWRPKRDASPEWWALHYLALVPLDGAMAATIMRKQEPIANRTVPTTHDWAARFPNVQPEFVAQPDAPTLPARTVDLWTVEKVATWGRRWLAEGAGRHPKMPAMSIYARMTHAGLRTVIDVGPLVVVALPEGRILK